MLSIHDATIVGDLHLSDLLPDHTSEQVVINTELEFENCVFRDYFGSGSPLVSIVFHRPVSFNNIHFARGLDLINVVFEEALSLNYITADRGLSFSGAQFKKSESSIGIQAPWLDLRKTRFDKGVGLTGSQIDTLLLNNSVITSGRVFLEDLKIGLFDAADGVFDSVYIQNTLFSRNVSMTRATIGTTGLTLINLRFNADFDLSNFRTTGGSVRFWNSRIMGREGLLLADAVVEGDLWFRNVIFDHGLDMSRIAVNGKLRMSDGTIPPGNVKLLGARINGLIALSADDIIKTINANGYSYNVGAAVVGPLDLTRVTRWLLNVGSIDIRSYSCICGGCQFSSPVLARTLPDGIAPRIEFWQNHIIPFYQGVVFDFTYSEFLDRVDFAYVKPSGVVDFSGAVFHEFANFNDTNLTHATFEGAQFNDANFSRATFGPRTSFMGAHIHHAFFDYSNTGWPRPWGSARIEHLYQQGLNNYYEE